VPGACCCREDTSAINAAITGLGVQIDKVDPELRRSLAYGMFDTRGTVGAPS
jgi:hypothetical protein